MCTNQNNIFKAHVFRDFSDDTVDRNLLANAGDITNSTFENKRLERVQFNTQLKE